MDDDGIDGHNDVAPTYIMDSSWSTAQPHLEAG
jgi:hypothetical protein